MVPADPRPDVDLYLHVRVLISMILGLSVTRLVGGVAKIILRPDRDRIWPIHLGWVAWALFNVITFWWWEFQLSRITHWTFPVYVFVCLYASMYFLLASLLFPDDLAGYDTYQDYFLARRAWFFGVLAVTEALDVVDSWIKGAEHLDFLGTAYLIEVAGFIGLCLVAMRIRSLKFHAAFVIGALAYEASFFGRYMENLR